MASPIQRLRALHPSIDIGFKALTRNRLQTGLTMLGITVGVATVLAMMAVGAGAQRSIEQQVRAAGLNQLTIKAGNWKPKTEDSGGAVAHQGDAEDTMRLPVEELMPVLPEAAVPGTSIGRSSPCWSAGAAAAAPSSKAPTAAGRPCRNKEGSVLMSHAAELANGKTLA